MDITLEYSFTLYNAATQWILLLRSQIQQTVTVETASTPHEHRQASGTDGQRPPRCP